MILIWITLSFIVMFFIDLPLLLKVEQKKKTIAIYIGLICLGLFINIMHIFFKHTFTPSKAIQSIVEIIIG